MKRYDLELTATGPVMEERSEGAFVPFSEVEQLQAKVYGLLEERNSTGIAINNAIRSGILPDKHPLRSRLELLANHHKREIELAAQLTDATRQCGVMADSLRYQREFVTTNVWDDEERNLLLEYIDTALAGKLTEPAMPEGWQLVPVEITKEMESAYSNDSGAYLTAQALHDAMLAAAPKPEG